MGISVKDLRRMDEISIRTQNSEYRFRVTEPAMCRGLLSGGLLGEEQLEASLCDGVARSDLQTQSSPRLEIGRCAFFCLHLRDTVSRFTTSVILDLSLAGVPTQAYLETSRID